MDRLCGRWLAVMAAAAVSLGMSVTTASATVRNRPASLTGAERAMVRHAGSLAASGLRTVTGATLRLRTPRPRRPAPAPTPAPPPPTPTPSLPTPPTPTPSPPTTITVDAADPGASVSPALFGSDFLAPDGGMGAFNDATGAFYPSFASQVQDRVSPGSLRFPGGITAQAYQWQNAIGPQDARLPNSIGPNGRPSPSTVGPDEFGQLLDATGALGIVDVDFANGTAREAADFVQYMTDRVGSGQPADTRAADGHPAPYDVPYWEVGNEQQTPRYWLAGSLVSFGPQAPKDGSCGSMVNTCLYIYGGTTRFTGQPVVGAPASGDRSPASASSTGLADQRFQVQYPPIAAPSTMTVQVSGDSVTWHEVPSLSSVRASDKVFTLDPTTDAIVFGDGTHGAIPPPGTTITASYQSGPHDGFDAFYAAMKAANPSIHVCSADPAVNFVTAMGTQPYDCLQDHPYVGAGDISPVTVIDRYESQVMAVPDVDEVPAVQSLQSLADQTAGHHVPLVLSEYGQLINSTPDPLDTPYFMNSLDEALLNASQLADWIHLGIPVADRQLLDAQLPDPSSVTAGLPGAAPFAVTGAIATPGESAPAGAPTVLQATGLVLGLMKPLAGGAQLSTSIAANPVLTIAGTTIVGALSAVSSATAAGIQLVVINRSPLADVATTVAFSGVTGSGTASVTTLDGPTPLSANTAAAPDTVATSAHGAAVVAGSAVIDFPAHSVTLITLPGA